MTDIKQYLPYCVGRRASFRDIETNSATDAILTYDALSIYAEDKDYTIIPHMRKLSSLTEEEAKELLKRDKDHIEGNNYGWMAIKPDRVTCTVKSQKYDSFTARVYFNSMNGDQFHYLTTIGIAWWATDDMWESGALIEINQEQK